MKQGCRLARLFGKSIMDFYARNQYFLMNTQPILSGFVVIIFPNLILSRRYNHTVGQGLAPAERISKYITAFGCIDYQI